MKKVAVVLSGCGRADGAEIHESVSVLIHLSRHGFAYRCFAPDAPQSDVINHATNKAEAGQSRNCMVEAARISRGEIAPVSRLDVDAFDAVVFPGGFGAAKNLCTFAVDGPNMKVDPDVVRVIKGFHAAGKPIGLCCIAPVLAAKVLGTTSGGPGCELTVGGDGAAAGAIATMGAKNIPTTVTEVHVDRKNRIATTAAYMCEASPHEVYVGIGKMIDALPTLAAR